LAPQLSNGLGGATLRFDQLIDSDNTAVASSPLDHTLESLVERSVYVMDSDRLPHLQRVVYKPARMSRIAEGRIEDNLCSGVGAGRYHTRAFSRSVAPSREDNAVSSGLSVRP